MQDFGNLCLIFKFKRIRQRLDEKEVKRGEVYLADLSANTTGSEQGGQRPVLIIQNNVANKFSPTVAVAALTNFNEKLKLPTHIFVPASEGFHTDSVVLVEHVRTIDKGRLSGKITDLSADIMEKVDQALLIQFQLNGYTK